MNSTTNQKMEQHAGMERCHVQRQQRATAPAPTTTQVVTIFQLQRQQQWQSSNEDHDQVWQNSPAVETTINPSQTKAATTINREKKSTKQRNEATRANKSIQRHDRSGNNQPHSMETWGGTMVNGSLQWSVIKYRCIASAFQM
jgi:hypothetical protein